MSPFEVGANSNHNVPTVVPVASTMNATTESNTKPSVSSQNSNLRASDSVNANSKVTSDGGPSSTRRRSLPAIMQAISNISSRRASLASIPTTPSGLESKSTTSRNRGQSITKSVQQKLRSTSISLQRSVKHQRNNNDEGTIQEEIVYSDAFTLDLPLSISRDKSELDYLKRTNCKPADDLSLPGTS